MLVQNSHTPTRNLAGTNKCAKTCEVWMSAHVHLQGFLNHAVCRYKREVSENVRRIVFGKIVIENARGFRAIYDKTVRGA